MNEPEPEIGRRALAMQVGQRFSADWTSDDHRARRLVSEVIGTSGLTFVLSGGAAILAGYGGASLAPYQYAFILSAESALWLVAAVYFLGDISAHFNPAMTLAFTLRGDMGWPMALAYFVVQFSAAALGSLVAASLFGHGGNLAATIPQPGQFWQAVAFEAIMTFGMVLLVLSMANGPKLNGSFVPIAVGAYVMAIGTMGGPYRWGGVQSGTGVRAGYRPRRSDDLLGLSDGGGDRGGRRCGGRALSARAGEGAGGSGGDGHPAGSRSVAAQVPPRRQDALGPDWA